MKQILHIRNLVVDYPVSGGKKKLRAVNGVSFSVGENEIVGLVGESGCGKTTIGNAVIGLAPVSGGSISFRGRQINLRTAKETRQFRRDVQMVFQDPLGSLNTRMTVGQTITEVLFVHRHHLNISGRAARFTRAVELLHQVGLDESFFGRYPHELSGGQRQRVGIARALAVRPRLLIADEPVSALDVSIQVQILNLLKDLSRELKFACIFIAHDLAVVRYMCDRTLVMYLGEIVESGDSRDVFDKPRHPYTRALLAAVPDVKKGLAARGRPGQYSVLRGEIPTRLAEIQGCTFASRCPDAVDICRREKPCARFENGHMACCHLDTREAD